MTSALPASACWTAQASGAFTLTISGALSAITVAQLWDSCVRLDAKVSAVNIDLTGVTTCDGAGLAMIAQVKRLATAAGATVLLRGASAELAHLIDTAADAPRPPEARQVGVAEDVGLAVMGTVDTSAGLMEFTGETLLCAVAAVRQPRIVRWRDALAIAAHTGFDAIPVTCLLGFIIGFIIAFQTMPTFQQYGAGDKVSLVVGVAMVRELGPLITGIVLAGRTGSAFAAELGTMVVTNEIDALRTFGLNPVRFLVLPRMLAAAFTTPFLSLFATIMGVLGGFVVVSAQGVSLAFFVQQLQGVLHGSDLIQGVFKAGVFALLVTGVGCAAGLATKEGPGAVGASATRAVVAGIVLVIISDGIMGWIFFMVGI
ncbi:MAG: STAS domain-containing protein [Phycisphaerales bacterium]|nr:STAS domain-containing protein [Phycisphaerales bacterium]